MAKLGQLVLELAANTARLQSDLGKAVGIAERGAAQMKRAFSFVTAGVGGGVLASFLIGAAKNAIKFGDDIGKAAVKAGIGTKAMSELAYVAKLADVDLGALSTALKKMQVNLSEAGTGSKQAQGALDALGLTVAQLQKRKPEAQFELIADRISKLADPADRARAATELFGKAGADLLPLFEKGAAGIAKATAEARKLGLSFGESDINNLSAADDSIKRLTASWEGFAATMTAKVAPAISDVLDNLSGLDTRSAGKKISDLEGYLSTPQRFRTAEQRAALEKQLSDARGLQQLEQLQRLQTGTIGGPTSRSNDGTASGYAAADAAAKAKDAAAKAAIEYQKELDKFAAGYSDALRDMNREFDEVADQTVVDDRARWVEREDAARETYEKMLENEKELAVYREQKYMESARIFRDYFVNAIEDMINTGKFKWRDFLSFLVAELLKKQIGKLFDQILSNIGGSGGGGGIFGTILGAIASAWGGGSSSGAGIDGRASGGSVSANRTYLVGESGPELFRSGTGGSIVPNRALGGGPNVTVINQIDARGATVDAIKLLPSFGKQISDQTEARIVSRLRRDFYGLNA